MLSVKKSKYAESAWKDGDFVSFWQHYTKVQEWVRIERECRKSAMEGWEWHRAEIQCMSLLSSDAAARAGPELDKILSQSSASAISNALSAEFNANRMPAEDEQTRLEDTATIAAFPVPPLNDLEESTTINLTPPPTKRKKGRKQQQKQQWMNTNGTTEDVQQQQMDEVLCPPNDDTAADWQDDEPLGEDMKAFMQTTLDHRKQREQKKREEQQKKQNGSESEEYFDASNLSFKATHQRTQLVNSCTVSRNGRGAISGSVTDAVTENNASTASIATLSSAACLANRAREYRRQSLYGAKGAAKLDLLEAKLHAHFEAAFDEHTPDTWPNIPLRF